VQLSSHAGWTAHLLRGRPHRLPAVLGSVTPDLPALGRSASALAIGIPRAEVPRFAYRLEPWRHVHLALHAVWPPAVLWALMPRGSAVRAFAGGWFGHVAVDFLTHNKDAWPALHPFSDWRWRSPVSYWDPEHHGQVFTALDLAGLALAYRDRPPALAAISGWAVIAAISGRSRIKR